MATFRTTKSRSNSIDEENSKDLKSTIRESRWIQPEQWNLPEIQEKFPRVNHYVMHIFFHSFFNFCSLKGFDRFF